MRLEHSVFAQRLLPFTAKQWSEFHRRNIEALLAMSFLP
jgi:hypothetical protein